MRYVYRRDMRGIATKGFNKRRKKKCVGKRHSAVIFEFDCMV